MKPLRIATCSSEIAPFSKSGGLGDVAIALPRHLQQLGHDVIAITPLYSFIKKNDGDFETVAEDTIVLGNESYPVKFRRTIFEGLPVYFVGSDFFNHTRMYGYEDDNRRLLFFNRACVRLLQLINWRADVIHCHDWQTGLIPNLIKTEHADDPLFRETATLFTIHNLLYQRQGMWWDVPEAKRDDGKGPVPSDDKLIGRLNFAKRGIRFADVINTVSERYAQEILTPEFGQGLDGLLRRRQEDFYGIINGVDYNVFNPAFDPDIWSRYDWNNVEKKAKNKKELQKLVGLDTKANVPLLGMQHRLTEQKGFTLLMEVLPTLLKQPVQIVVVGSGDRDYQQYFRKMAGKHPDRIAFSTDFNMASKVYAGTDMFLMPSRFEPCGVSQLISLRYGSVPIVHKTGGLSDTISDFSPRTLKGNGFVFPAYTHEDFLIAIIRAVENYQYPVVWKQLMVEGMRGSYSWELPAKKYVQLYQRALKRRREPHS